EGASSWLTPLVVCESTQAAMGGRRRFKDYTCNTDGEREQPDCWWSRPRPVTPVCPYARGNSDTRRRRHSRGESLELRLHVLHRDATFVRPLGVEFEWLQPSGLLWGRYRLQERDD